MVKKQDIKINEIPVDAAPEYVSTTIAARILGMSPDWLTHARVRGEGPPFVKFGGAVRYHVGELREWGAAQVVR